ncbi:MAG TPA: hypothetical protein VEU95_04350 [Micropepsaceae bacterium]|nr:hypothetical protein [Micropepsaceae bacterium]
MSDIEPLILDLLEWLDKEPQPYLAVMDAWRTSCPHLPVWEDSVARGFVAREWIQGQDATVRITGEGREFLYRHRRGLSPTPATACFGSRAA